MNDQSLSSAVLYVCDVKNIRAGEGTTTTTTTTTTITTTKFKGQQQEVNGRLA